MKLLEKIRIGEMKKVGLPTALVGRFLAFVGASSARRIRVWWLNCALADQ